jgi:hypothetical protein
MMMRKIVNIGGGNGSGIAEGRDLKDKCPTHN